MSENAAYGSSASCDSIIVSPNSYLKEKIISTANTVDFVIFADKVTSAARKDMMGLFLSAMMRKKRSYS